MSLMMLKEKGSCALSDRRTNNFNEHLSILFSNSPFFSSVINLFFSKIRYPLINFKTLSLQFTRMSLCAIGWYTLSLAIQTNFCQQSWNKKIYTQLIVGSVGCLLSTVLCMVLLICGTKHSLLAHFLIVTKFLCRSWPWQGNPWKGTWVQIKCADPGGCIGC